MDWDMYSDLDWGAELIRLKLEQNRKKLHAMLDGRSIRELSDEERSFALYVLTVLVRLKRLEDLTNTEIIAILEELIYTLAEAFYINPQTKDWEKQLFSIIELERMKGRTVQEIIADRLSMRPIWDDMGDWLMPEAFSSQIYEILKHASEK